MFQRIKCVNTFYVYFVCNCKILQLLRPGEVGDGQVRNAQILKKNRRFFFVFCFKTLVVLTSLIDLLLTYLGLIKYKTVKLWLPTTKKTHKTFLKL